jgi:AcrR family transcriptional regulator
MVDATGERGPAQEIMEATYRALCRHGYADLTMQDIAHESTMSKAALHYHYDSKRELLLAFLDHLFDRFEGKVPDPEVVDPVVGLERYLETLLTPPREGSGREFRTAVLEIKAQAPYDQGFRDRLTRFDRSLRDDLTRLLTRGAEAGLVDENYSPAAVAEFLVTVLVGSQTRQVTVGAASGRTRRVLADYVNGTLFEPATREVDL